MQLSCYIFIFIISFSSIFGFDNHYTLNDLLQGKLPRTKRDILNYLNIMDFEWVQKFLEKLLGDLYVDLSENDKFMETYILPEEENQNSDEKEFLPTTLKMEKTNVITTTEKPIKLKNTIKSTKTKNVKNMMTKIITSTGMPFLGTTTTRKVQVLEKNNPYKIITPTFKNSHSLLRTGAIKEDNKTINTTPIPIDLAEFCVTKCEISHDYNDNEKLIKYANIYNSEPEEILKGLLKESQIIEKQMLPVKHKNVDSEVVHFTMNILRSFKPLRSLVIGVFTGYSTIAISLMSHFDGIVIGLEDPELIDYWEAVGKKASHNLRLTERIQIRATDSVERELHKLVQYEPTTFDFILLDDFKYGNYLVDYEMAVNILRSDGILIITSSFANKILSKNINEMTDDDKIIRALNHRIKNDNRIVSTLLPISDGTWFIVKK
ncbi:O-methyltransferase, family 3-containing protein [Strongyloides ratti]|uniref:O-methyltransferase, family 3-containing protein n=1 Tax=Strongyloides ratti TaxID=34506 RepID=A0A090LSH9_STRRB|nr:O-methyltransferase, family 3-containing protein [Strongyloides ratti]CEF71167.1 O-methyltransferase, family 3-containing protein [Strongyloides ratti]